MKFRDGMWQVAEGYHVEYAEEVYQVTQGGSPTRLTLLCPTAKIMSRGDTLNRATLTITLEAVADGIMSVETTHWHGAVNRGPHFDLFPNGRQTRVDATVGTTQKGTVISSGAIRATVSTEPHAFSIRFHSADGKHELTSMLNRSVGFAYDPPPGNQMSVGDMRGKRHYIFTQTTLGVGEQVFGLGERFGAFNKVGQHVTLWNADGGTSSEQAYKNVPFWMSSRNYGVFIDHPERIEMEVGSERSCRVQTSVEGQRLKWYILYGPTPKEVLQKYSLLTGKPGKVPSWSFGLWLSTSFTTNYDEQTVMGFLEGMKQRNIPVEVFHFDCFWLRAFHWCDFVFSSEHFPDPKGQIARMKSSGLVKKTCVWINPYLGQASPVFAEAASKGYLLKRTNGDVWQWDVWQSGMALVDFTNPAAVDWYENCLVQLFETGVDCLKTDFGERIPTLDVQWHDPEVDPKKMHNFYAFLYNKVVYEALQKRYGRDQAVLFARSATAGTQRFPLQWGGDCESTFEAMAESVRGGLSLGLCGYSFWSVDIGGFEGTPDPTIYKRWVAFGLLCSHSRLHGSNSYRVPWLLDGDSTEPDNASEILAHWTQLKCRLMPYLYAQAMESIANGWPLSLRAMSLEFPEDRTAWFCDAQFMLGSSILVAPVFSPSGEVEFYVPEGRWTSFWDEKHVIQGPRWFKETHGFKSLPFYVREGTILVLGKEGEKRTVYDYAKDVEIRAYFPTQNSKATIVDNEGQEVGSLQLTQTGNAWELIRSRDMNVASLSLNVYEGNN